MENPRKSPRQTFYLDINIRLKRLTHTHFTTHQESINIKSRPSVSPTRLKHT
ncbi:hypothetical protein E2C01_045490 [Portunus trituberculatus]|uniref:Uncharacterized protein n=1 Tax=Portunus trituberculatus TaxID=210409 RepID=A0A5B7G283_PORTR|nr:hypothetical protein [Portunus trituberculatus]